MKFIAPIHVIDYTGSPGTVQSGFKKFYLKNGYFKLFDGATISDVVLDRPLDNFTPLTGVVTSADTVLTALEKLQNAISSVVIPTPSLQQVVDIGNAISNYNNIGTATIQSTNFTNNRTLYLNNNNYATIKIEDNLNANHYVIIDIDTINLNGTSYNWSNILNQGTVTSIGVTVPSAFNITPSTITTSGTFAITGAGTTSQYVRGDGTLGTFPGSPSGGGASISYYLNGSILSDEVGYKQMSKNPIFTVGTDFTTSTNGLIAQFLTDAGDPALLNIPGGAWLVDLFFNANSSGGTPSFYVELLKYDGTTFTSIASSITNPEVITNGTAVDLYTTSLAVPTTTLTLTDRIAIRVFVNCDGKTITLHTENSNLSEVVTTFSTAISALNGLTAQIQYLTTGTSGTDFNINSSVDTHTFNLPIASAFNTGKLSNTDWLLFYHKISGSGNVNYVPKFTGPFALTESLIYDNGTNVGINTTNPGGRVHIYDTNSGASAVYNGSLIIEKGTAPSIQILSANNQTQAIKFGDPQNGQIGRIEYSHANDWMRIITNNTLSATIDSIGITLPSTGSFIKTGGTSFQYLMADGSVTTGPSLTSPLTTKGDLYTFSTVDTRLPVGTDGQILTANSSVPEGLSWQDNYADWTSTVKHIVKNNGLSGTITKGTAVYVTSSDGANILVGRASNTSEATSSKTMGLMQSNITTTGSTQTGFVITEGLLGGLNTAIATAGDPVWLGVNGALIYGLANKPYAPAHLVFIGIVTKVSSGNGEIFVKIQNGFELNEIHDVDLKTTVPSNGEVLTYESSTGLWKNKPASGGFAKSINSVSINTAAGSTASTDYFYFASGTINITLPTAVGNNNTYVIKNVGTGIVTIDTTSSQTIDGSLTAPLRVQYLSLTIISDGANWNII